MRIGLGLSLTLSKGVGYLPETLALFERLEEDLTPQRKRSIDNRFRSLIAAGILAKLDGLHIRSFSSAADQRLNWLANQYNASTAAGAPTYAAYNPIAHDGVDDITSYGFNPSSAGGKFTRNSACFGVYNTLVSGLGTNPFAGRLASGVGGVTLRPRTTAAPEIRINQLSASAIGANLPTAYGVLAGDRSGASALSLQYNGINWGTATDASIALSGFSGNFISGGNRESSLAPNRDMAAFWGEHLTDEQHAILARQIMLEAATEVIFAIAGDSNAEGRGTGGPAIASGVARQYWSSALAAITGDPVGDADTGSMYPAFANAFHARTGRKIVFRESANGGSALLDAYDIGNGSWGSGGTLAASLITQTNAAVAAICAEGGAPVIGAVLLTHAGVEANAIDDGSGPSQAQILAGYQDLIDRLRDGLYQPLLDVVIARAGTKSTGDTIGRQTVRAAQEELAASDPHVHIGYRGASEATPDQFVDDETNAHWGQEILDAAGTAMGQAAASALGYA